MASFSRTHRQRLEPISKSFEEDHEAGELDEAEEVLAVVLPADEDAALPLDPGEGAYVPCARTRHVWGQGKAVGCVPPTALLFVGAHFTKKNRAAHRSGPKFRVHRRPLGRCRVREAVIVMERCDGRHRYFGWLGP